MERKRELASHGPFDDFLMDLEKLSMDWSFGELRDRIIAGITDANSKNGLLLQEGGLRLEKGVNFRRASELAGRRTQLLKHLIK